MTIGAILLRPVMIRSLAFLVLLVGGTAPARAQQCLGRPIEAGEMALAARLELDGPFSIVSGEVSGVARDLAWSATLGAAADELVPPGAFGLALGAGGAWTGLDRSACPAAMLRTVLDAGGGGETSTRRTQARFGFGLGRRLGEERIRGAAFLFPHLRLERIDSEFQNNQIDDTRHEWWFEGGFSLRGERLWGMAVLGVQVGNYSPGEDVIDGSLRFSAGVAF